METTMTTSILIKKTPINFSEVTTYAHCEGELVWFNNYYEGKPLFNDHELTNVDDALNAHRGLISDIERRW